MIDKIGQGDFVEARGRPWLVEAVDDLEAGLTTVRLSCIADDAQGEQVEILWDAEIGPSVLAKDTWSCVGRAAPDSPEVLAAYVRAIRWRFYRPLPSLECLITWVRVREPRKNLAGF